MTALFDKVIIASGDSNRQVRALANNVCVEVRKGGGRVFGTEGEQAGEWVLVDLGSIIVHVMQPAIRQYYRLEDLWGTPPPAKPRKPTAAKSASRRSAK
jgi:ribosome-associated protein